MEISTEEVEKLKELEESLWRAETRFDKHYMGKILAPDFFEFGRSGRVYKREETLAAPAQEIKSTLPLKNFQVQLINQDVVLVTYVSEVHYDSLEISNRSSVWSKTSAGWHLRFHQGTPVQSLRRTADC